jgi:hypothetical protein
MEKIDSINQSVQELKYLFQKVESNESNCKMEEKNKQLKKEIMTQIRDVRQKSDEFSLFLKEALETLI